MSTYKFSIHGYHSIKPAEIDIDSISVIADVDGTGRSTISMYHDGIFEKSVNTIRKMQF